MKTDKKERVREINNNAFAEGEADLRCHTSDKAAEERATNASNASNATTIPYSPKTTDTDPQKLNSSTALLRRKVRVVNGAERVVDSSAGHPIVLWLM